AATGDISFKESFIKIATRHIDMVKELAPEGEKQTKLLSEIGTLLDELQNIFNGIYLIKDLSTKTANTIVSYGERLSSIIVSKVI
ncbi:MAG: bifunctional aspartate kinase/homoserine dehydrogenase I, partial [Bacteroides sp.]